MKRIHLTLLIVLAVALLLAGCGSAGAGGGTSNSVPPPQNLVGTFAMDNGKAAVMDIKISGSASSSQISASATYAVSGNVRYEGEDYTVGGLYDDADGSLDLIAENSGNGQRFLFSGTYTEADGFSGTVRLLDSNGTELAKGSVSAAGVDDNQKSSVKVFVGTFGGTAAGTWNGTLTATRFYGTYADVTYGDSGSFGLQVSGNSVSENNPNTTLEAGGTVNGNTISGWWRNPWVEEVGGITYSGTDSGSWTGSVVDSNYDAPSIDNTSDPTLLTNLVRQAFENVVAVVDNAYDIDGDRDVAEHVSGSNDAAIVTDGGSGTIDATYTKNTVGGVTYVDSKKLTFNSYVEPQTGVTLDGGLHLLVNSDDTVDLDIDSDLTYTSGNDTEDSGLTVTFEGGATDTAALYVNVVLDYSTNSLTGTWKYDGTRYESQMEALFFGN